jgi:hypothetical protein
MLPSGSVNHGDVSLAHVSIRGAQAANAASGPQRDVVAAVVIRTESVAFVRSRLGNKEPAPVDVV